MPFQRGVGSHIDLGIGDALAKAGSSHLAGDTNGTRATSIAGDTNESCVTVAPALLFVSSLDDLHCVTATES